MDQWTICITYFSVMRTSGLLLCTWTNVLSYYCLNVTPTNHGKCRIISFPTAVLFVMPLDESLAFLWIGRGIISAHLLERKKLMGDTESCHGLHELECQFRKRSDALQSLKAAAQRSPNQSAQHRLSQACRTKTESEKVAESSWHRTSHPSVGSLHTFAISDILD